MSTGIVIEKAVYGAGSSIIDVSTAVTTRLTDGTLQIPVSASALGVDDPAPGQVKTLTLTYSINGGRANTQSEDDGGTIFISAPAARAASGLQITKAEYGYDGNWTDVTEAVQNMVSDEGEVKFKVGFKVLGIPDPNPNQQKTFKVRYTLNGGSNFRELVDGKTFHISAPSATAASNFNSSTIIGDFMGATFTAIFAMIGYQFCVKFSPKYGDMLGKLIGAFILFVGIMYSVHFAWITVLTMLWFYFIYFLIFDPSRSITGEIRAAVAAVPTNIPQKNI